MSYETEKLTVNLGVVELAQIDVLVDLGLFSSRSDFIRTAVRSGLEANKDKIENQLKPLPGKTHSITTIGVYSVTKQSLEKLARNNEKISIHVIGMAVFPQNIGVELFTSVVESCVVRGKLVASDELREFIDKSN